MGVSFTKSGIVEASGIEVEMKSASRIGSAVVGIARVAGNNIYYEIGDADTTSTIPTFHGFAEQGNMMKVYDGYITTTEFIEY